MRHSAPDTNRIELVKRKFLPTSARIAISSKLYVYSPAVDVGEEIANNSAHTDNRAGRSGSAETVIQHTLGHIRCGACLAAGSRAMLSAIDPGLTFDKASSDWLESHSNYISKRTAEDYRQYIEVLKKFGIGPAPLKEIAHMGTFAEYQEWRKDKPKRGAGNPRINQELNCLSQILDQAGLWKPIKDYYKPLRLPKWKPPRVMTPEKEDEVLQIAASNPNWEVALCALTITNNSGIGPGELRAVLIEHVHLDRNVVDVAAGELGAKNEFRTAPMALNKAARAAMENLLDRYYTICNKQGIRESGQHFLLPYRVKKGTYDPTRQASTSFIRSALREIRAEAGMPRLRHYDFRHQCLTSMLEIPEISEETVQAVARHRIGTRTIEHYSAIRIDRKQKAVDALEMLRSRRPKRF